MKSNLCLLLNQIQSHCRERYCIKMKMLNQQIKVHVWEILRKLIQMIILPRVCANSALYQKNQYDHVRPGHHFKHDNYLSFE